MTREQRGAFALEEVLVCALETMERVVRLSNSDWNALLGVSRSTAHKYAEVLKRQGVIENDCRAKDDKRSPHFRLSKQLRYRVLTLEENAVSELCVTAGTGETTRISYPLSNAILQEEAREVLLRRLQASAKPLEWIGVIASLKEQSALRSILSDWEWEEEGVLTADGCLRKYGAQTILYLRYDTVPDFRIFSGGQPLSAKIPPQLLKDVESAGRTERLALLRQMIAQISAWWNPSALLLESRWESADIIAQRWNAESNQANEFPPIVAAKEWSFAEEEMIARLRRRLSRSVLQGARAESDI